MGIHAQVLQTDRQIYRAGRSFYPGMYGESAA